MKDFDVLCVGVTSYDLVFNVDHHPQANEKSTANALLSCGGGPAANAAITVARMGLQAAFCGYLGMDILSDMHFAELQSAHVNTELLVRGKEPLPMSVILVKPNGERSLVNYRSSNPIKKSMLQIPEINPKVILYDGHEPDISLLFLEKARKKNILTVLDAGSVNKGTSLLYDKVDYLVCSQAFAADMTGLKEPKLALQELFRHNRNVVITLGEKGLIYKTAKTSGHLKAFNIKATDSTGAGDVFHGAFARCLALKKDWDYILKFSSAAAALSCTKQGARTSIPTLKEVRKFLRARET